MDLNVKMMIETLARQKTLMAELCDLAGRQLQALKENDPDKIREITGRQEYAGRQLAEAEQKRRLILDQYSRDAGIEINSFSELEKYAGPDDFGQIQMIRDEMIGLTQKLKEANELNSLLLRQSLQYTDRILGVLHARNSVIYGRSMEVRPAGGRGIVDTNV